jgi:Tfp pilus assembly protein PilF
MQRAFQLNPDCVEARFGMALVALARGDRETALAGLREVLRVNPRHPRANLVLAKLYTEDGDASAGAACLAAHARFYGNGSRSER